MLSVYVIYSKEVCLRLDHCVRLVKLRNIEQLRKIPNSRYICYLLVRYTSGEGHLPVGAAN